MALMNVVYQLIKTIYLPESEEECYSIGTSFDFESKAICVKG
jgi:hypothetical protein